MRKIKKDSWQSLNKKIKQFYIIFRVEGWYSPFQSFPLTVTSRSKSVSVIISSSDIDHSIIPYAIEFVAVKRMLSFKHT